ncbi:hypothetical protein [Nocardia amamiensis]|uniref:hypothetical protein n=1 Tax=Nocardia amamiensis TaxID=404578 RepID=UPI00082ED5ED|nr:hypothetical protein [Nocardia amamiensis]
MKELGDLEDFDALEVAREQLRYAMIVNSAPMTLETRLQLGLLAAQVALAERLPLKVNGTRRVLRDEEEFVWDEEFLERFLRNLGPSGRRWIRVLVDEGGVATPGRIKEVTGAKSLGGMSSTMRRAMHATTDKLPPPRLIQLRTTDDPQNPVIVEYRLAEGTLPVVTAVLERIDGSR